MNKVLLLLLFVLPCFSAQEPAIGTVSVTTTPLNVFQHFDKESGKRFLIFVLTGKDGAQTFQVVEATKATPTSITINMAPLLSFHPEPKKPEMLVEAPDIPLDPMERTSTWGKIPEGWKVYRTEVINGGTLNHIERPRVKK